VAPIPGLLSHCTSPGHLRHPVLWPGLVGGVSVFIVSGRGSADLNHKLSEIPLTLYPDGLVCFLIRHHMAGAVMA
jgi:hypothetical protein